MAIEKPFNVGAKVLMRNPFDRKEFGKQVWVVTDVKESGTQSQSGWLVSVEIVERGHDTIRVVDYDANWFVRA